MSVTAAEGFVASGMHAGIKPAKPDLALIATDDGQPVPCVAVFTTNKFTAPPVDACRDRLAANGGRAAGVIVNSPMVWRRRSSRMQICCGRCHR